MMKSTPDLAPLQIELREAMGDWGCPLCRLRVKAEQAYIRSLNYERVLDLNTRDGLKLSRGLCEKHSRQWEELQGSALGIAIVYRVTILDLLRDTDESKTKKQGFFRRQASAGDHAETLETHGPCLACEIGSGTVDRFTDLLLQDLDDSALQEQLLSSGGLCLPHLRNALTHKMRPKTADLLISVQRKAWQKIMGELEEFIRKNDYRFQHEAMTGEEGTSWSRVLDMVVGLKVK
jgi:hypothetical protein